MMTLKNIKDLAINENAIIAIEMNGELYPVEGYIEENRINEKSVLKLICIDDKEV